MPDPLPIGYQNDYSSGLNIYAQVSIASSVAVKHSHILFSYMVSISHWYAEF